MANQLNNSQNPDAIPGTPSTADTSKALNTRNGNVTAAPQPATQVEYGGLSGSAKAEWSFRARRRLFYVLLCLLIVVPIQAVLKYLPGGLWWPWAGLFHTLFTKVVGVNLTVTGKRHRKGPVLFVSNHISWLDIVILGGVLPRSSFVAKSQIAGWGAVGWLAKLQRTIFVNRERRHDSSRQSNAMLDAIAKGDSLILFPEGTSTLGQTVSPFKSSLFAVAEQARKNLGKDVIVQPVTLAFTDVDGIPLTRQRRPLVAWVGDMELVDHAREVLATGSIKAHVHFHDPMTLREGFTRKAMALQASADIAAKLDKLNGHRA